MPRQNLSELQWKLYRETGHKSILTGKQEVIDKELAKYSGYPKEPDPGCQCIPGDRDSRTPCFCDP